MIHFEFPWSQDEVSRAHRESTQRRLRELGQRGAQGRDVLRMVWEQLGVRTGL